jgi:hypothetical protein
VGLIVSLCPDRALTARRALGIGGQSCPILEFTMTNKLTPQQQAAQAEFAAFDLADAEQERKETRVAERRKSFHKAFYYDVPHWPEDMLHSVIESMVEMGYRSEAEDGYSIDPYSDSCRDHFFSELVLRLTQDVPFATTADFLRLPSVKPLRRISSPPPICRMRSRESGTTPWRRLCALSAGLNTRPRRLRSPDPIQHCTRSPAMVPGFLLRGFGAGRRVCESGSPWGRLRTPAWHYQLRATMAQAIETMMCQKGGLA